MAGDYTRMTFDPLADFAGVLMQQGRVQLDADWNELVQLLDRRLRADAVDSMGRAAVPRETPEGFEVTVTNGVLALGRGRIYVDGLLAENHGAGESEFDRVLGEPRRANPVPYREQPYVLPEHGAPIGADAPPAMPATGRHLVYLDVWQRELTAVEHPALLEPALGDADTTTRVQTVWQARVLENVGEGVDCGTPDAEVPGWAELTAPSGARLAAKVVETPQSQDPCVISPSGGYSGLENQLYRVEVHDGGPGGTATFKWSRDNGSVATRIAEIAEDTVTVGRVGRDAKLRFAVGDWVEVTDDRRELAGRPGEMRTVVSVDEVARRLKLNAGLPADLVPADPARNPRIRKWDQRDQVLGPASEHIGDVDPSRGVVPIPADPSYSVMLEDGVVVTLSLEGGQYRTGDYWLIPARTATGQLDWPADRALPPRGVHHHYCRLAVGESPDQVRDCRVLWPPLEDRGCECSACVTPESHRTGTMTIQRAVDQVRDRGGKVCLAPGAYDLGDTPIDLTGARGVELSGAGWRTALVYLGRGAAINVRDAVGATVSDLTVLTAPSAGAVREEGDEGGPFLKLAHLIRVLNRDSGMAIALRNCLSASVERCVVYQVGARNRIDAIRISRDAGWL
jgi:hypothetical protein